MKILFSGYHNPLFMTITEYIERAIQKTGHSLISFDDRAFIIPGRIRERAPFLQSWDLNRLNNKLISLAFRCEPALCLISGGQRVSPETIEKIKSRGIKTALWTVDAPSDFQPVFDAAPLYDFIFCGGTEAQELLAKSGVRKTHWLPFASDPEIHKPEDLSLEEKKKWGSDVTFVGSFYPNRSLILENISDLGLKVWGPGWDQLPSASPLKKLTRSVQLKPEEWRKILSGSKMTLAIHYQNGKTPCYQASPKVYETMACQSFLLVDNQKDVRSLFEDGRHLVIFKDIEDIREKIAYYLNHSQERKEIARQGYEEVIKKHTYIHRIKKLVQVIYPEIKD
jgi:spore maturation protein CgeB